MTRILFQGDSITDGARLKDPQKRWDLNHQIGHSYVFSVVGRLGRRFPGKYCFINRGVSGDTVEKISERWQTDTLDEHPDVLSLLLGVNGNGDFDGVFSEGIQKHLESFEAGYRNLLRTAREQNPNLKLIIMEPFCLPNRQKDAKKFEAFQPVFARKQALVKEIAEKFGAIFIPVQESLNALVKETAKVFSTQALEVDPMAYWLWDGVHPTEQMHDWLADLWLDATKEMLQCDASIAKS